MGRQDDDVNAAAAQRDLMLLISDACCNFEDKGLMSLVNP